MAEFDSKPTLRAPNGNFATKVDEAGRIKLPARIRDFLQAQPDKLMFATYNEPNSNMAKIYFNGSWERNKAIVSSLTENREAAKSYMRMSNRFGGDVDIDSNGRVTLPQELRAVLQLRDTPVQLLIFGEVLQILKTEELDKNVEHDQQIVLSTQIELEKAGVQ